MKPIDFQQYKEKGATPMEGSNTNGYPLVNPHEVKLYTMEEAAKLLGVSKSMMYKLTERGEVPFLRFSTRLRRIRHTDLLAFIEKHMLGE
jgi:excisionase family DNA binding protein